MKSLSQLVNEGLKEKCLFESFESQTAEVIFNGCGSSWEKKDLGRQFQWDKIPEDAFEEIDCESAKKLAYKVNSSATIFWFDSRGKLMFLTWANYSWKSFNGAQRMWKPKSVKKISELSSKAILLKDEKKYSTSELRKERAEAKANATALMSADEIRKENIERYKRAIAQLNVERSADSATMLAKLNTAMEEYNTAVSDIMSFENEMLSERVRAIEDLNTLYGTILSAIRQVESGKEDNRRSRQLGYGGWELSSRWLEKIVEDAKKIDEMISKLRERISYWKGKLA